MSKLQDEIDNLINANSKSTTLDLSNKEISAQDIAELLRHLESKTNIRSLTLDLNQIGDEGAKALAGNTRLVALSVVACGIGAKGAEELARTTSLRYLNIGYNGLNNEVVMAFSSNTSLTSLKVTHCGLKSVGAKELAKNTNLRSLAIGVNEIGDEGAQAFADNTTLTTLNLNMSAITDVGAKAFIKNTTIKILDLSNNSKIQNEAADALLANRHLFELDVFGTSIDLPHKLKLGQSITLNAKTEQFRFTETAVVIAQSRRSTESTLRLLPRELLILVLSYLAVRTTSKPEAVIELCNFIFDTVAAEGKLNWRLSKGTKTFFKKWNVQDLEEIKKRLHIKEYNSPQEPTESSLKRTI